MSAPTTNSMMYQTMHRQPDDLRRVLTEGWEATESAASLIGNAKRIFLFGIGTSFHAAQVGAWLLRATGRDARAVMSFDVAHYPENIGIRSDDAVIVMAHSGVKTFSKVAMQTAIDAGATVISIGSLTAEHPGSQLVLRTTEREKSAAFTSSHLTAMTVLAQIATALGGNGVTGFRDALTQLPDQVREILSRQDQVLPIAKEAVNRQVYAIGAGPNELTATELVIKAREAAYGDVDALASEQFLHGPLIATEPDDLAVVIHVPGAAAQRVGEIARVIDAIGTKLWIVGQPVAEISAAMVFTLPETPELISPLLAVVPMQLLAYQMAVEKGINPDTFRRDNPVYQAALGLLTL